jgi:hypothetical protein
MQLGDLARPHRVGNLKMAEHEKDLEWIVENRSKIQRFLLDLHKFDHPLTEDQREKYHHVFGLLVGIAFSLWRAVFLSVSTRTMKEVTADATELLRILIATNTVGFPQDLKTEQMCLSSTTLLGKF